MSDEEEDSSQSEVEEEEVEKKPIRNKQIEENEGDLALKKRREAQLVSSKGLDDAARDLLESNRRGRELMEEEIIELRQRNEKRKKEREAVEKKLTAERAAEDERKKLAEESKKKSKNDEDDKKPNVGTKKLSDYDRWKNQTKPNFVINRKDGEDDEIIKERKSKEQLETEKRTALEGRIFQLKIDDLDAAKLKTKAKEFQDIIYRLESEKYDMEKQFKTRQFDMMDLAERSRQANKVGKGGLKRVPPSHDQPLDKIQELFAGAPAKVMMYSKYERQKDKRKYDERVQLYTGPQFLCPPDRIKPTKVICWTEEGLPIYSSESPLTNGTPAPIE